MPLCRERCYLEDRNIRLATVLYCLAMVLNTSSSLTNAIASIGLSLDTQRDQALSAFLNALKAMLASPNAQKQQAARLLTFIRDKYTLSASDEYMKETTAFSSSSVKNSLSLQLGLMWNCANGLRGILPL